MVVTIKLFELIAMGIMSILLIYLVFFTTRIKEELRRCPFCGSSQIQKAELVKNKYNRVYCKKCGCGTSEWNSTIDEAIKKWNTRKH